MIVAHDHNLSVINITANQDANKSQHSVQKHTFSVVAATQEENRIIGGRNNHALATENSWGNGAKITSMVYSEADKKIYMGGYNKKVTVLNLNLDGFNS